MVKNIIVIESDSLHPHHNQALEAALLDIAGGDSVILYLWANDKTVFIGKNQNAYTECNIKKLLSGGGYLARRITGGGAVYHDKGNLNFTFIADRQNYSVPRQFEIIKNAIKKLGLSADVSGRNDITIEGKKFSGNAFLNTAGACMHHGTILIGVEYKALGEYLCANEIKLKSKGVKSVAARVVNLKEYDENISYFSVKTALIESFKEMFPEAEFITLCKSDIDNGALAKWYRFFSDEKHIMGDDIYFNLRLVHRFEWGTADIRLELSGGVIKRAKIYSDTLDTAPLSEKEAALIGKYAPECGQDSPEILLEAIGKLI